MWRRRVAGKGEESNWTVELVESPIGEISTGNKNWTRNAWEKLQHKVSASLTKTQKNTLHPIEEFQFAKAAKRNFVYEIF